MDSRVVGVLGGGQLGRMMAEAGFRIGVQIAILDPGGAESPAGKEVKLAIEGSFRDEESIRQLASVSDLLTYEIEHVNCDVLEELERSGKTVQPSPATVRIVQDKYQQKLFLQKHGAPLVQFKDCPTVQTAVEAGQLFGFPFMLKAKKLAYDGRGNRVVNTEVEVRDCFETLGAADIYAEQLCPFIKELAVMIVRTLDGQLHSYPLVETVQKNNLCHTVLCPADIAADVMEEATRVASSAISFCSGAGIFGVKLFLLADNSVLLNEITPRPHNSGHYTTEACECDQFENHLRAILGLPIGGCRMIVGAALIQNIIGGSSMEETVAQMKQAALIPEAKLHWYGKSENRPGRKMGHVTFIATSLRQLSKMVAAFGLDLGTYDRAPEVAVIMGSDSDLPTMKEACRVLDHFNIPYECTIVSAHRTPSRMFQFAKEAASRGLKVIIAGAGGAAHLPGMCAALTPLPVIGVPVKTSTLSGVDSLHSIVQMPRGVPVATVAIGNATNAGLLAVRMLGTSQASLLSAMDNYMKLAEDEVLNKAAQLEMQGYQSYMQHKFGENVESTVRL